MNVGDEEAHPWLEHEYELERGWVEAGTPLLSICLGAQTLAHAFGASVGPAPQRQAGFRELSLSAEGRNDPLLGILPPRFEALFANGYRFELPARAVSLVECRTAGSQGFRLAESAWALQFHPEVHASQVLAWWREEPELPRPFAELAAELEAGIAEWQRHGRALCRAFLAYAAAS